MENDTPATAVSLEDLRGHDEGATREEAVSELIVTWPPREREYTFGQPAACRDPAQTATAIGVVAAKT